VGKTGKLTVICDRSREIVIFQNRWTCLKIIFLMSRTQGDNKYQFCLWQYCNKGLLLDAVWHCDLAAMVTHSLLSCIQ